MRLEMILVLYNRSMQENKMSDDELYERYCEFLGNLDGEAWYDYEDFLDIFVENKELPENV